MTTTPNLGLKKPDNSDVINIQNLNDNADILDGTIADEIAARKAADEAEKSAIAEIVDNGAKNRLQQSDFTTTTSSIDIPCVLPPGKYVLYRGNLQSTDTDANTCLFRLYDDSGGSNVQRLNQTILRGEGLTYRFTITDKATFARFYPSDTAAHSSGDTLTAENMMICPAELYDISTEFVEYCPTLAELYKRVLVLENAVGNRSLQQSVNPVTPDDEETR